MKPTLVVYLDGLSYTDLTKEKTPFLYSIAEKNHQARLKTLLAYTGIEFAFYSGKYPDETGIWQEFVYSPETSPFSTIGSLPLPRKLLSYGVAFSKLIKGNTCLCKFYNIPAHVAHNFDTSTTHKPWKTLPLFRNLNFIYYGWPFFARNGKYSIDPIPRNDAYKVGKFLKNVNSRTLAYFIHMVDLDKATHDYGRYHEKTLECMRRQDNLVRRMHEHFAKVFGDFNFIAWSDHGFHDIKGFVRPEIRNSSDCLVFYGSTIANFWFKDDATRKKTIASLKRIKEGHILTDAEKKKYHIPLDPRHGELNFVLNPGYMFLPNYYQAHPIKSMHGYQPEKADLDAFLVSNLKIDKKVVDMTYGYKLLKKALN